MRRRLRPGALLLAAVLAGCTGAPADRAASLFPLQPGHAWTYRVTTTLDGQAPVSDTLRLSTVEPARLGEQMAWRRRSSAGLEWWLRADETGIYRVASRGDRDPEPAPDAERRYVLRAPYATGTAWETPTAPYLLRRRHDYPREMHRVHPAVPMTYTIEADGEAVDTAAGRYEGCLRVRGIARLRLYADAVNGWREAPLTTLEWYCPGPGLVRLQREEPTLSALISGGSMTMELTGFR